MEEKSHFFKKIRIDKYALKAVLHCPPDISLFGDIVHDKDLCASHYDFIFVFIYSLSEFHEHVLRIIREERLNAGGVLFFAYPKKGNKQYKAYIGRDDFFDIIRMDDEGYVQQSSIKFNRMVALNDVFTVIGLKHQVRRMSANKPSQCVADYVEKIEPLRLLLSSEPQALSFFEQLTPGYQRGWARYVYGVKQTTTQQRRLEDTIQLLLQGYKTKN